MARPTSRYFVPVIRKIMEIKKAENILIDEGFKASLRVELMKRAALNQKVAAHAGGDKIFKREGATGESVEGRGMFAAVHAFLGKWKYQLALVPVAFVLALVAVQSLMMSVKFESQTVKEVASTGVKLEKSFVSGGGEAVSESVSGNGGSGGGGGSEIADEASGVVNSLVGGEAVDVVSGNNLVGGARVEEAQGARAMPSLAMPTIVNPNGNTAEQAVGVESAPARVSRVEKSGQEQALDQASLSSASAPVLNLVSIKKPGIAAGDVPPELAQQVQGAQSLFLADESSQISKVSDAVNSSTERASGVSGRDGAFLTDQEAMEDSLSVADQKVIEPPAVAMPVEPPAVTAPKVVGSSAVVVPNAVEIPAIAGQKVTVTPASEMPKAVESPAVAAPKVMELEPPKIVKPEQNIVVAPDLSEKIYYDFSFSGDKADFENKVLKNLLTAGGYVFAAVSEGEDGIVTVELSLADGKSITKKMYKFNNRTRLWDQVFYVRKYYYDNSLQYERLNLAPPSFYYTQPFYPPSDSGYFPAGSAYLPSGERVHDTYDYRYGY